MPKTVKKEYKKAEQVIKKGKSYTALIQTSAGDITVELSKDTPITTNNFVFLAQDKFYDNVIFHRVIPSFMIQGGDPTGTGMGGPGYKFADEKFKGEYKRGAIAMANSGKDTNGSQFFIMHADYALPPNYVIFGMAMAGLDVVDKIATAKTGPNDRPVEPVVIKTIEITEK
jgi:cyclophilin family peptidyl-prolyl cis-trans isomerase